MKTKLPLLLIVIALSAFSSTAGTLDPHGERWFVQGLVLNVVDGGLLITVVKSSSFGMKQPEDRSAVFIAGKFRDFVDDDPIALVGEPSGTYRYTSVTGSGKTIRAFQLVEMRAPQPPLQQKNQ